MYSVSVPVMLSNVVRRDRKAVLAQVRAFDAKRVFLALDCYEWDPERRRTVMRDLAETCRFFKDNGFEVGAWVWTFWFQRSDVPFRFLKSVHGTEISGFACPSDPDFVAYAADYIRDLASTGVDILLYDDDFRYGFLADGPACLCDGHIAAINARLGADYDRETLSKAILSGGKNDLRDAWLAVNGAFFEDFAAKMRQAVDSVDPAIRLGVCTCMTSWDVDGTDAARLARILAGGTRPLLRLTGAPYWAYQRSWGNALQDVVELERMESAWTADGEIEIMAEGDAFPRPRLHCPAAYLEGFDTAIRASGCTDGILKYGADYVSAPDYEPGYERFHARNRALYAAIDRHFVGKPSGVRVYESMRKAAAADEKSPFGMPDLEGIFFSKAARSLAHTAIPTVYEGKGCFGICFDENARTLPHEAAKSGLILDIGAAAILTERGWDVGVVSIGEQFWAAEEHFLSDGNDIALRGAGSYHLTLKEGAEVLSCAGEEPFSYRYENAAGERFLVLNVNTRGECDDALKTYARARQYHELAPWLGSPLPAYVDGCPEMYLQCREEGGALTVGVWNFFADIALSPRVQLARSYTRIDFVEGGGTLDGDTVTLTDIPAFGFAGFTVF